VKPPRPDKSGGFLFGKRRNSADLSADLSAVALAEEEALA
jgi:hypothetical protein